MRSKKSQITIFIIVGIIILFATFFFLFIRKEILKKPVELPVAAVPLEAQPVKTYIEQCLEQTAIPGIYLLASQGGYIYPPIQSLVTETSSIAYKMPTLSLMEQQLNQYISFALPTCIDEFKPFKEQGFDITSGEVTATANINRDNVDLRLSYPVTVTTQNSTAKISSFVATVPIRLGKVYDLSRQVSESENQKPEEIDVVYLGGLDITNLGVIPYDSDIIIYTLHDSASDQEGNPFVFSFASSRESNSAPEIEFVPDFVLSKGKQFIYQVSATDPDEDAITFSDDSDLFGIDPQTGEIRFVAQATGNFETMITATDSRGKSSSALIRFRIK